MAHARRGKTTLFVTSTIALAILCVLVMSSFGSTLVRKWLYGEVDAKQRVLLYQTDHQAVHDALRAVWEAGKPNGPLADNDPDLPQAIRHLDPHRIVLDGPCARLEFGGAEYHYGFEALFGPMREVDARHMYHQVMDSRKLREDLWFYADKGLVDP